MVGLGVFVGYRVAMKVQTMRLVRDRLFLHMPLVGRYVKETLAANFSRVFATMLRAGVPLDEALAGTQDTTTNEVMRMTLGRVRTAVREGERMTPVVERAGVFPPVVCDLAAIGEESGELGRVFERVAGIYEEKLETDAAAIGKLVTPAIVIVLGLVVGFIAVALFGTYATVIQKLSAAGQGTL
jgi:type II secretory pathway component PulF